jgi:hypothetical protein
MAYRPSQSYSFTSFGGELSTDTEKLISIQLLTL